MPAASVIRVEDGYWKENDCAIVALSMYLDKATYPDVIRAVAVTDRAKGRKGLSRRGIVRVAATLGHTLRQRKFDPVNGHGVLVTHNHAAVLLYGRVLDRYENWPLDLWLIDQGAAPEDCSVYTAVDV
jgi:hypothetical protein